MNDKEKEIIKNFLKEKMKEVDEIISEYSHAWNHSDGTKSSNKPLSLSGMLFRNAHALYIQIWEYLNLINNEIEDTVSTNETQKYYDMIRMFASDFSLAKDNAYDLCNLQDLLNCKDRGLLEDMDLLFELESGLSKGALKIIKTERKEMGGNS